MKIFIRADGGKAIGIGHIMRTMVLAKELKKTNEVIFLSKKNENETFDAGIKILKQNNFLVEYISEKEFMEDIISLKRRYSAECIITDSYDVDTRYFDELKKHFKLSGYIDDVNKCYMNVDFIINQNINALDIDYSKTTNKMTKLFLGTKYCMMRDEFINEYEKKVEREDVLDILLTLGGMDDKNNTLKLLHILEKTGKNIHVVIGKAYSNELIRKLNILSRKNEKIILHENAIMSDLMCKCDVAIAGCGSTLYELCAMKVPSIGIIIAKNQKDVAEKMVEDGIVFDAYDINKFDEEKFRISLGKLITDGHVRKTVISNQQNKINMLGKYELADKINEFIKGCDGNV